MTDPTDDNPYLLLGFWEFAILATLMVAFFPWSLLFCLVVYGMEDTKAIIAALIHDGLKTLVAVSVLLGIIASVGLILLLSL